MRDLIAIPNGTQVFVDTMIFYLHFQGRSAACTALINRIAQGEIKAYVNTQVLSELLHKLMLAEAYSKGFIRDRKAAMLKKALAIDRSIAANLLDYQLQFEDILAIGLEVLPVTSELLVDTKVERKTHGLMTGDSLHNETLTLL